MARKLVKTEDGYRWQDEAPDAATPSDETVKRDDGATWDDYVDSSRDDETETPEELQRTQQLLREAQREEGFTRA